MILIDIIKYIILGIIQGFTEPIPVSSSGHLVIIKSLFNLDTLDLNFEILVNFGSLLAIVLFFRKDIINLIKDFFSYLKTKELKYYDNFKYCLLIVVGTIPAGILGLIFKDTIESVLSGVKVVGLALLITALFLFLIRNIKGNKKSNEITFKDALIVGLFQSIALFPGISRSGATLVGAMFLNFKRDVAFKFSFMLYIPISLATLFLGIPDIVSLDTNMIIYYIFGLIASFIVTYFSTKWFKDVVKNGKLIYFVGYCLIVGFLVLLFL